MTMPKMDAWLPLMMQIAMTLPTAIQTTEMAFSGVPGKSGEAKKQLVLLSAKMMTDGAVATGLITAAQQTMIMNMLSPAVDTVVGIIKQANGFPAQWAAAGAPTP